MKIKYFFLVMILFSACKKEGDKKQCWYLLDLNGGQVGQVCDKSKVQMESEYTGSYYFYSTSDPTFCWKIQHPAQPVFYLRNIAQYPIDIALPASQGYSAVKVDCNSFCNWEHQDRRGNKNTGIFTFGIKKVESFLPDSCTNIFAGKEVIIRETTDSVYYRKFIQKQD